MGQLVLLVVAAAWAAVLIPPLLRSRLENRPNSSVTDFRNQLSSLQKAVPARSVTVRSMARPLAPPPPLPPPPSPLRRPAAAGRPVLRSGVRTHERPKAVSTLPAPQSRTPPPLPAEVRSRTHGSGARAADRRRHRPAAATSPVAVRAGVKRRRANVLFVLVLIAACSLFLAATMQTESLYYVAGAAFVGLCAYVYVLAQRRKREVPAERRDGSHAGPAASCRPRRRARPRRRRGRHRRGARSRSSAPQPRPDRALRGASCPHPAQPERRSDRCSSPPAGAGRSAGRRPPAHATATTPTRRSSPGLCAVGHGPTIGHGRATAARPPLAAARSATASARPVLAASAGRPPSDGNHRRGHDARRYTLGRPRGCSSVGRAQQSHC